VVNLWVGVRAAVLDHDQPIVSVAGMKQSGKNNSTRGDPEQNQRFNLLRPQNHVQVCSCKSADPVLGYDNVLTLWRHRGMNRAGRSLKHLLVLDRILDGAEQLVARTDFRQTGTKADLNVKDAQPVMSGRFEDAGSASEQARFALSVS